MQKLILLFPIILVLTACEHQASSSSTLKADSSAGVTLSDEVTTPDIRQLRRQYVLSYHKPIEFESDNKGKGTEQLKVWGKYYCLFDNGITIPGKYNPDDTTKTFTTHNFAEDVVIISNGDTILRRTISKKDFKSRLPKYLRDYAVIFEPTFEGYDSVNDAFDFSFSVSIPLTDVGQLMRLSLKRSGETLVSNSN